MSESIFEHTTSIAGLTCKPLAILSETISSEEMSRVRGGDHHLEEPPETGPPPGTECPPGCQEYCCDPKEIIIVNPNPEGPQNPLPPLGSPSPPSGSIFTLIFRGDDSNSAPADSSNSAPADSSSADTSGTQDQNGGALDNVDEEPDWGEDDGQEDDKSVTDHIVDFFRDIYDEFDDAFNVGNHHPDENGDDSGMEDGEDDDDEDNGGDGDN